MESWGSGWTLGWAWDALGRQISETSYFGAKTMQYDLAGRMTRLTWPDSFYVTYDHLVTGEVSHVRENGAASGIGVLATYTYDNLGRRTLLTRGNGTSTTYSYDNASRLSQLVEGFPSSASNQTLGFTYNPAAQIVSNTRTNDAYSYTARTNGSVADTINGLNQVTQTGATTVAYGDQRGNITGIGATSYSYASDNRLVAVGTMDMAYDAAGRLAIIYSPTQQRLDMLGGTLISELDSSNAITRRYVHGPGVDEPLVQYEGSGTSDRRWLHADERGSIVAVSNSSGAVTNINSYDEYGVPAAGNVGRFQYTGQAWIPEIQLYYYRARFYNPTLGRFMQTDPIGYGDGMNLYGYVGGDPVNMTDPSGLGKQECPGAVKPKGRNERKTCAPPGPGPSPGPGMRAWKLEWDDGTFSYKWLPDNSGVQLLATISQPAGPGSAFGGVGGPSEGSSGDLPPCSPPGTQFDTRIAAGVAGTRWSHANNMNRRLETGGSIRPHSQGGWTFRPSQYTGTRRSIQVPMGGRVGGWYHNHTPGGWGPGLSYSLGRMDGDGDREISVQFARNDPEFATVLGGDDDTIRSWTGAARLGQAGNPEGTRQCR